MDLPILISKKGTKVVLATQLYQALELANHHYAQEARKWINDFYEFADGIRKPVRMQDYAPRKTREALPVDDYYLSLELAKQIALRSRSRNKQRCANWLSSQLEHTDSVLSSQQFMHLLELTRAMSKVSCQEASEREHLRRYKQLNDGEAANWWNYRAALLGYSAEELRNKIRRTGKNTPHKTQRQLLAAVDRYELIRAGIIDLFMAIGKGEQYARQMGDLAKTLAREMQIEMVDDRAGADLFSAPQANEPELIRRIKEAVVGEAVAA
jgi:phage anti-repressor protein